MKEDKDTLTSLVALNVAGVASGFVAYYWFGWSLPWSILFGVVAPFIALIMLVVAFMVFLALAFRGDSR